MLLVMAVRAGERAPGPRGGVAVRAAGRPCPRPVRLPGLRHGRAGCAQGDRHACPSSRADHPGPAGRAGETARRPGHRAVAR